MRPVAQPPHSPVDPGLAILPSLMGLLILLLLALLLVILIGTWALQRAILHPPRLTEGVALARGWVIEPSQMQLDATEATFSLSDGTTTPGWVIAGQNRDGPTLIFLHGYSNSRFGSLRRVPDLLPYVHSLILYDQRGQGDAQARTCHFGTTEVEDVLAILDQIEAPHGVVLFGSSMGAGVAMAAGHRDPRIRGIIGNGANRHWQTPVRLRMKLYRYPTWPLLPLAGLILHCRLPQLRHYDRAAHAAKLTCPLLLLHGSDDGICPLHEARQIAEAAPDAKLIIFQGGYHSGLAEHDAEQYQQALADFFASLPEKPASDAPDAPNAAPPAQQKTATGR